MKKKYRLIIILKLIKKFLPPKPMDVLFDTSVMFQTV